MDPGLSRRAPHSGRSAPSHDVVLNKSEGERIILSGGGGVSPDLPRENIQAILSAFNASTAKRCAG